MANSNPTITRCVIGEARVNYPKVFEPESFNGGAPAYNVTLSFPKENTALLNKIEAAIEECKAKFAAQNGGRIPKNFVLPLIKDGDTDYESDGYAGLYTIKLKSKFKPELVKKVKVMGKTQLAPITDEDEFYAGCYCYAAVDFFAYSSDVSKGISAGLSSLLKSRDGERFVSSAKGDAADTFADVLGDIDDIDDEGDVF